MVIKYKNYNCDVNKIIDELQSENIKIKRDAFNDVTNGFLIADKDYITLYLYEKDDLDFLCMALSPIEYYIPKIREIFERNGATPV